MQSYENLNKKTSLQLGKLVFLFKGNLNNLDVM